MRQQNTVTEYREMHKSSTLIKTSIKIIIMLIRRVKLKIDNTQLVAPIGVHDFEKTAPAIE